MFFITMTCNPNWPEIQLCLCPGQIFFNILVIICRVFRRKLSLLEQAVSTMFPNSSGVVYIVHVVEFQKRGLPHAHILVKLAADCAHPQDIDCVISAEIPRNSADAALVRSHILHRHPALTRPPSAYCQHVDGNGECICRFKYPKELQPTTTIDSEVRVNYRCRNPRDKNVVSHSLALLCVFKCYINIEIAKLQYIFQYVFKYIHKGGMNPVVAF